MRRRINFLISAPAVQVAEPLHPQPVRFRCVSDGAYGIAFGAESGTYGGTHDFDGILPQQVGLNCIDYLRMFTARQAVNTNLYATASGDLGITTHARTLSIYSGSTWLISTHRPSAVEATFPTLWSLFQTAADGWQASTPRAGLPARYTPTATMVRSTWSRM